MVIIAHNLFFPHIDYHRHLPSHILVISSQCGKDMMINVENNFVVYYCSQKNLSKEGLLTFLYTLVRKRARKKKYYEFISSRKTSFRQFKCRIS